MSTTSPNSGVSPRPASRQIEVVAVTDDLMGRLTLPRADRPLEAALHEADQRARDTASSVLDAAFPSLPIRRSAQCSDANTLVVGSASPQLLKVLDARTLL